MNEFSASAVARSDERSKIHVVFGSIDQTRWRVTIFADSAFVADADVSRDVDRLARLAAIDVRNLTSKQATEFGQEILTTFFPGEAGQFFRELFPRFAAVPILIECQAEELHAVPWELLPHPYRKNRFLALTLGGSVVRVFSDSPSIETATYDAPSALFVFSSPEGINSLSFEEERTLAKKFTRLNSLQHSDLSTPSFRNLSVTLNAAAPAIFWYSGHAKTRDEQGKSRTYLVLADDVGAACEVDFAKLARAFKTPPWILVLNACESANGAGHFSLPPAAADALNRGTMIFIGNRNRARQDIAHGLARDFLTTFVGKEPADESVSRARRKAYAKEPRKFHWANFVIFARKSTVIAELTPISGDPIEFFQDSGISGEEENIRRVTTLVACVAAPLISAALIASVLSIVASGLLRGGAGRGDVLLIAAFLVTGGMFSSVAIFSRYRVVDFIRLRIRGLEVVVRQLGSAGNASTASRQKYVSIGMRMLGLAEWSAAWSQAVFRRLYTYVKLSYK